MFLGDFLDDVVGDAGAVAKTSEMELLHFSAAAHIVHQIVGVSFSTDKSHRVLESAARSRLRPLPSRSVRDFHYTYQDWMQRRSRVCKPPGWKHTPSLIKIGCSVGVKVANLLVGDILPHISGKA